MHNPGAHLTASDASIATKLFTINDQNTFAELSGDRNPMHMDEVAARRTQAGMPVVHGIHALLWSLDCLVSRLAGRARLLDLQVGFKKWIHVGKTVHLTVSELSESRAKIRLDVDGLLVAAISIRFDFSAADDACLSLSSWDPIPSSTTPLEADLANPTQATGSVVFPSTSDRVAEAWPNLAKAIGPTRVAALMATSTLVGMNCPGLHSMYKELTVTWCSSRVEDIKPGLVYEMLSYDERFRLVQLRIEGHGQGYKVFTGTVKAVAGSPVKQPRISDISMRVNAGEFSNTNSLIVGGSRGLGELTAKALVAGGGRVTITYAAGRSEADRVRCEIADQGGVCETMHYDARKPATAQLKGLSSDITHMYYFATPVIYQSKGRLFVEERFSLFVEFYVRGFFDLCAYLAKQQGRGIRILYPSTVFAVERPQDMTEYAMAKVAGETLCADMNRFMAGVHVVVKRFPRMETDQTASVVPMKKSDSIDIILPVLREMCMQSDSPG